MHKKKNIKKKTQRKNEKRGENSLINGCNEKREDGIFNKVNDNNVENEKQMLKNLNPKHLGFKTKLSESEKRILLKEVFGIEFNTGCDNNDEEDEYKIKPNVTIKDYSTNTKETNINYEKRNKKKSEKKEKEDTLSYLDGDCYFPQDGYDYEQHLKPISKNIIEIKKKGNKINFFEEQPKNEDEKEALQALEMDDLEELNDNFILEAQEKESVNELIIDDKIMWGEPLESLGFFRTPLRQDELFEHEEIITEVEQKRNETYEEYENKDIDISKEEDNENVCNSKKKKMVRFCSPPKDENIEHPLVELDDKNKKNNNNTLVLQKRRKKKKKKDPSDHAPILNNLNKNYRNKIVEITKYMEEEAEEESTNENTLSSEENSSESNFDCETILTTRTNTTNHPHRLIIPKKLTPELLFSKNKPIKKKEEKKNKAEELKLERYLVLEKIKNKRDKNETPEEKKERRRMVREAQRLNRKIKKENILLFKKEKKIMTKKENPFDIKDNVKYIKL